MRDQQDNPARRAAVQGAEQIDKLGDGLSGVARMGNTMWFSFARAWARAGARRCTHMTALRPFIDRVAEPCRAVFNKGPRPK